MNWLRGHYPLSHLRSMSHCQSVRHRSMCKTQFFFVRQIVLECNEKLRVCLDDHEVSDAAMGLLNMYRRLLKMGIIFKVRGSSNGLHSAPLVNKQTLDLKSP